MEKVKRFFVRNWFLILVVIILLIAFILRFYDYGDRFALGPDQAGFALQAKYAVQNDLLPLLGPFSSAGPFQTGGEWYWFVMIGYLLFPSHFLAPWIFLTLTSIIFILLIMFYANKLIDRKFAVVVGIFTAVSTAQVAQSTNLTNQSPMAIFSVIALISSFYLLRSNKSLYAFIMGLMIGIASSIHLQGIAMLPIFISTFIFGRIFNFKKIAYFIFGGLVPWIPVLLKDSENNFFTVSNMINYYVLNDNPIPFEALGRRWLTFIFDFIPNSWANVIGGNIFIGYLIIILAILIFIYLGIKKKLTRDWLVIYFSLGISIILLRYTRTPIFYSYIVFIHPMILLISGYVVYFIYKNNKYLGIILFLLITFGSIIRTIDEIKITGVEKTNLTENLQHINKFSQNLNPVIYDYDYKTSGITLPLVFMLESNTRNNHLSDKNLGFSISTSSSEFKELPMLLNSSAGAIEIYDLPQNLFEGDGTGWILISGERIFNITQNWYKID